MSRIHPSSAGAGAASSSSSAAALPAARAAVYTVWQRSSMGFQGTDGFSVYDAGGGLAFRVDNYSRRRKLFAGDLLLMDGRGAPLLALIPQIISMHDQWNCYKAAEDQGKRPARSQQLFSMRKCSVLQSGREAQVFMCGGAAASPEHPGFWVEGCFRRRSCKVRNGAGEEVARITRKKAGAVAAAAPAPPTLGDDVFSLVVQPGVDAAMIMAFVVVLDRICWKPYAPLMCSS